MGSNPTSSIESSVRRITENNKKKSPSINIRKNIDSSPKEGMRDLYDRENKLLYWIKRAESDLEGPDKTDVLKLIEYLQDQRKASLWIIRYITALISMRKQITKPFRNAKKNDIRQLINWMDNKEYKASTIEKFRIILKSFYKIVYGNNKKYPKAVDWFPVSIGKERFSKEKAIDLAEYLEEEEVQKLIECAPSIQKKAFISCMYESGARPEEFLRLTNNDIQFDTDGALIILRGKTGERRVRIISFAKLMQQWLDIHPLQHQAEFSLWISEATNFKNEPLGIRGAEKILSNTILKSELQNKQKRLYILRHSRATYLASHFTEAQMCVFFGWVHGTKVVRRYIHLSGKDLDNKLISLNSGIEITKQDFKLKTSNCIRCKEILSPTSLFCGRCGLSISLNEQYLKELEERENKGREIDLVRKEMNQKINRIMELLKQNNNLTNIKPEVLSSFLDKS